MRINKCNLCGKVLDPKKDKYYSVSDISFHTPQSKLTRLHLSHGEEYTEERSVVESWTDYCDLDFCEECFEQVDIKRFL